MRIGEKVYLARRVNDLNAEIGVYEKPIEIITRCNYFTVMPASSRGGLAFMKFGERIYDTWTAYANALFFGDKIKEGDVMWVDGHSPVEEIEQEYGYGSSANAVCTSAVPTNTTISIILVSNQEQIER